MVRQLAFVAVLGAVLLVGCDRPVPPPEDDNESTPVTPRQTPSAPDLSGALFDAVQETTDLMAAEQAAAPKEDPEMVSEVATVGVGKKGRGYGGGIITEPVRAYFRTGQRIAFEITIPQAMKTYRAMDPQGKGPKSHEEFMETIIRENNVELPMLPDGYRYRYDPETEDLLVEHPKRS